VARNGNLKTTILLADDHVIFRQGLAALLRERGGFEVVAEAGNGEEAVDLAGDRKPRIVLLDVEMPRLGGIEAARGIQTVSPESRIVVLSMYADVRYQERAREAGASAFVLKHEGIDYLIDTIDLVLRGAAFVSKADVRREQVGALRSAKLEVSALSAREKDVLRLLVEGNRTREIAASLGIGVKSVETYRSRLMHKLGIRNLAGLTRLAIRAGLITPES
jgi:DNA-binding NarL/FixJ family response regulator